MRGCLVPRELTPSELLHVTGRCRCPDKTSDTLRIRIVAKAARVIQQVCGLDPDLPVLTYWCPRCKAVLTLTARDLHLVA